MFDTINYCMLMLIYDICIYYFLEFLSILILFETNTTSPLEAELQKAFEGVFLMVEVTTAEVVCDLGTTLAPQNFAKLALILSHFFLNGLITMIHVWSVDHFQATAIHLSTFSFLV